MSKSFFLISKPSQAMIFICCMLLFMWKITFEKLFVTAVIFVFLYFNTVNKSLNEYISFQSKYLSTLLYADDQHAWNRRETGIVAEQLWRIVLPAVVHSHFRVASLRDSKRGKISHVLPMGHTQRRH